MTENPAVKVLMTRQVAGERLKDNDVPLRSKLYGLVPCGLGTVWQESLTSYLNRLAGLHHVSPLHLAAQEIVPHLTQGYSRQQLSVFSWSTSMSVNGNGPLAREWASILEGLTKRSDLHFLTLQWWVSDLPSHKLLREKPACGKERAAADKSKECASVHANALPKLLTDSGTPIVAVVMPCSSNGKARARSANGAGLRL